MSLSKNIKVYRQRLGLTQEQLAERLGVSSQAVSKWETTETYPDGALLPQLATALSVSLDRLFDHEQISPEKLSEDIISLIGKTPVENRFSLLRAIGWQIEKGMFYADTDFGQAPGYSPEEMNTVKYSSHVCRNEGFTYVSNGKAPFFSVFPEPENGFAEAIGDGEMLRKCFAALGDGDTMKALLLIMKQEEPFVFDQGYLCRTAELDPARITDTVANLLYLGVIWEQPTEVNGEQRMLYVLHSNLPLLATLLMAREMQYCGPYTLQSSCRSKPLLS